MHAMMEPEQILEHAKAAEAAGAHRFCMVTQGQGLAKRDFGKLLDAAKKSGADAIHPGYGFLSENADFAQAVIDANLIWIGPSPQSIRDLGDKVSARHIAQRAGAPAGQLETTPEAPAIDAAPGAQSMAGRKCPECGAHAVIRKDGCDWCTQCGHVGACG